tara:strand:+ start:1059 stop:3698 length:2640 start_codon:yes stop_codon:yes gene_type:complete
MPKKGTTVKGTRVKGTRVEDLKKEGFAHAPPIVITGQFGNNPKALRQFKANYKNEKKRKVLFKGLLKDMDSGRLYLANEDKTKYVEFTEEQYDSIVEELGERVGLEGQEPRIGKPFQGRTKDQEVIEPAAAPAPAPAPAPARKKKVKESANVSDALIDLVYKEQEEDKQTNQEVLEENKPNEERLLIDIRKAQALSPPKEPEDTDDEEEIPAIEITLFEKGIYQESDSFYLSKDLRIFEPNTRSQVGEIEYEELPDINSYNIILIFNGAKINYGITQFDAEGEEPDTATEEEDTDTDIEDTFEKPDISYRSSQKQLVKLYKNIKQTKFEQPATRHFSLDREKLPKIADSFADGRFDTDNIWTTEDNYPKLPRFLPSLDRRNKQKFTAYQKANRDDLPFQFPDLFTYRWRDIWWVLSQMLDKDGNVINLDADDKFKFRNDNPKPAFLIPDEDITTEEEDTEFETDTAEDEDTDEEDEEDIEIVEIEIDDYTYYLDEQTNKIYDPESQNVVGLKRFGGYDLSEDAIRAATERKKKLRKKAKKKKKKEPKFTEAQPEIETVVGIRAMRGRRRVYLVKPPKFLLRETLEPMNTVYVYDAGLKIYDGSITDLPYTKEFMEGTTNNINYDFYKDIRGFETDYKATIEAPELKPSGELVVKGNPYEEGWKGKPVAQQIIEGYVNEGFDWYAEENGGDGDEDGAYSGDEFDEVGSSEWKFDNPPEGEISANDADLVMKLYEDRYTEGGVFDPDFPIYLPNLRAGYGEVVEGDREEQEDEAWVKIFKSFSPRSKENDLKEEIFSELVEEILSGEVDEILKAKILEEMGVIDSKQSTMGSGQGKKPTKFNVKPKKVLTQSQLDALMAARFKRAEMKKQRLAKEAAESKK